MFKFLNNLPIFQRLLIAFVIAAAIPGTVIVLLSSFYFQSLEIRDQAVRTSFDAQNAASQLQINLQRMNALLQTRHNQIFATLNGTLSNGVKDPSLSASGALINIDINIRELDFGQGLSDFQNNFELATSNNMDTIRGIVVSDDPGNTVIADQQNALNTVIQQQWPVYKALQDKELSQLQSVENTNTLTPVRLDQVYRQAYQTLFDADNSFTDLRNSWQKVVDAAVTMGKAVTAIGPSQTQPVVIATAIAVICTLLIVFMTGAMMNLTITQPLRQLATLTRRIARGDTSARAPIKGRDEINVVARSMNYMLDNIVLLIQNAQNQHQSLQTQVEKLVREVSGVGEGDLRVQAEVTIDALGVLADSFNFMVEELSGLIVRVKGVSREVERSTMMTADRMKHLVKVADVQIQQITYAAEEVGRVADLSSNVADHANGLLKSAQTAYLSVQSGRNAVQQTIQGIAHISENVQETAGKIQLLGDHSREITNIAEVITTIAQQTNRLALDAAVQAAMAGENGKGFGAVAADIRRLAEQVKSQAGAIGHIIYSVREDISAAEASMHDTERETSVGALLTQETALSLESIFDTIESQTQEMDTINKMTVRQLQASSDVMRVIHNVSDATQHSSASIHQVSQNMERLALLAEQLLTSVEAFKVREGRESSSMAVGAAAARNSTPPQGPFAGARRSGPFPDLRQSGQRGFSVKPFRIR